jgi:hypothetical protein
MNATSSSNLARGEMLVVVGASGALVAGPGDLSQVVLTQAHAVALFLTDAVVQLDLG